MVFIALKDLGRQIHFYQAFIALSREGKIEISMKIIKHPACRHALRYRKRASSCHRPSSLRL